MLCCSLECDLTRAQYIKATFPLGFTMMALSWGALSYGPGYDAVNQTAYLDGTLRWGFDWLMNVSSLATG